MNGGFAVTKNWTAKMVVLVMMMKSTSLRATESLVTGLEICPVFAMSEIALVVVMVMVVTVTLMLISC